MSFRFFNLVCGCVIALLNVRYFLSILCTGVFLYVLYRFVLIFNKFWFSSLLLGVRGIGRYEKFTARGSKFVLPHWGLEWGT